MFTMNDYERRYQSVLAYLTGMLWFLIKAYLTEIRLIYQERNAFCNIIL